MSFDIADFLSKFIIYFVVWIFAVSAHEAAHAWTSYKFGDDTAYLLGRVTLNPLPHIDPIGTFLLPILGFIISYSGAYNFPLIAWGKPTPVNPLKWRNEIRIRRTSAFRSRESSLIFSSQSRRASSLKS